MNEGPAFVTEIASMVRRTRSVAQRDQIGVFAETEIGSTYNPTASKRFNR